MQNTPTTILIFGAQGMLGQSLVDAFPSAVGLDREHVDITSPAQVENAITEINPSVVINAAAFNNVDACETDDGFAAAMKLNSAAPGHIAKICAKHNITFVHYSTNYVFAGTQQAGYAETDTPHPVNRYGETKLAGEELVRTALKTQTYYIIRTSKLFGAPGTSNVSKPSFFATMRQLAKTKHELTVVDDELGNFTYTPDLARFTKTLLEESYPAGTYHGVNKNPATWYAGARTLFDISGWGGRLKPVTADAFPRPAKRPHYGALLNTTGPSMRDYEAALQEFLLLSPQQAE